MKTIAVAFGLIIGALIVAAAQEMVYRPGDGVSLPRVIKEVHPEYTDDAKAARIQGTVTVEAVVLATGKVGGVEVVRPLDKGLDERAIAATRQWEFEPGRKDGKAVAVRVHIEHTFRLK